MMTHWLCSTSIVMCRVHCRTETQATSCRPPEVQASLVGQLRVGAHISRHRLGSVHATPLCFAALGTDPRALYVAVLHMHAATPC